MTCDLLEKDVEAKLVKLVKDEGGLCLKFTSPGNAGVPDRIVLLPGGRVAFYEVKRPGAKPRKLQEWWLQRLRDLGFEAEVFDGT